MRATNQNGAYKITKRKKQNHHLKVTQKLEFEGYMHIVDRKTESKNIGSVKVVQFRGHLIAPGNGSELKVWPT